MLICQNFGNDSEDFLEEERKLFGKNIIWPLVINFVEKCSVIAKHFWLTHKKRYILFVNTANAQIGN